MSRTLALDTSVAVPLLAEWHADHAEVVRWVAGRDVVLSGHAVAETYSVLTRLPGELRLAPHDAAELLAAGCGPPLLLGDKASRELPTLLASRGVWGGAVYDALVALAAVEHDADLATRDARARSTYEAVGARVVVVG